MEEGYTFFDTAECYLGTYADGIAANNKEKNSTPAQISLAWMICKKSWIVPIPGTRKKERMIENAHSADIMLTQKEVADIDRLLDSIHMSAVFGGHSAANQ